MLTVGSDLSQAHQAEINEKCFQIEVSVGLGTSHMQLVWPACEMVCADQANVKIFLLCHPIDRRCIIT